MCGRFTFAVSTERMQNAFPWLRIQESISPRWNIAPSQGVLVALNDGTYEASTAKWGLIPSWERAPDGGRKPINARIETLAESKLFAPLLRRKRCAIFADGFYEWATEDGKKIPYHFRLQGGEPFAFAGLWDRRDDLPTCTIITGSPNEVVATVHNRMPMLLARESVQGWIDQEEITAEKALGFLASCSADLMERRRASAAVNNPRHDASDLQT